MAGTVEIYFDRCVGTSLPESLRVLGLKNVYHQHLNPRVVPGWGWQPGQRHLFSHDTEDDVWLAEVGKRGWVVVGQDYHYHERDAEREAIRQHSIKVFYLWGPMAPKWEKMRAFVNAYDAIMKTVAEQSGPFIYRVSQRGHLTKQEF